MTSHFTAMLKQSAQGQTKRLKRDVITAASQASRSPVNVNAATMNINASGPATTA
jgi:hypothetical protein